MGNKNINIGIISASGAGLCTVLFAVFIIAGANMLSYFVCLLLSIFYLINVISNNVVINKTEKIYSQIGIAFAIIYCVLICIVYYTQITFVRLGNPSIEALSIVSYSPPKTVFFALDILGYTFLSLSTLFVAFTILKYLILKIFLIIHGIIGISGFVVPLLPYFYNSADNSSDNIGTIVLFSWCLLFIPICLLFIFYYNKRSKEI